MPSKTILFILFPFLSVTFSSISSMAKAGGTYRDNYGGGYFSDSWSEREWFRQKAEARVNAILKIEGERQQAERRQQEAQTEKLRSLSTMTIPQMQSTIAREILEANRVIALENSNRNQTELTNQVNLKSLTPAIRRISTREQAETVLALLSRRQLSFETMELVASLTGTHVYLNALLANGEISVAEARQLYDFEGGAAAESGVRVCRRSL